MRRRENTMFMLSDAPTKAPTLLPLEEPKKEEWKARRWWRRRRTDAEVIRHAIDELDERGWTRGRWVDSHGKGCLLGPVGVSAVEAGRESWYTRYGKHSPAVKADLAVREIFGASATNKLMHWNDGYARDVNEVRRGLLALAEQAEANGGKFPRSR